MSGSEHGSNGSMVMGVVEEVQVDGENNISKVTIKLTLFNTKLFWHHPIFAKTYE